MPAEVTTIAAVGRNRAIGRDGSLPWRRDYPEDMRRFRDETVGHPVILGRVTHQSIIEANGGPLEGRRHVVVSSDHHFHSDTVRTVGSPASALNIALTEDDRAYVIGGESIYRALLPLSNRLLLTEVPESPDADAFFPEWDTGAWELVETEEAASGLVFREYRKPARR
jgi:dihydrofolate reductase